ncbi:monovalent cation/H+ antiporter subunit A [Orrella sp. JC864]|uniref:monovalent cation/H+ antiporter subunit A n=1 Tax=Orrella sp. JC864 TaxID=3120298 RepID=UPI0030094417
MNEWSLLWILGLPFAGCLVAALMRPNARNAEAWLAGLIALAGLVQVALLYPRVADGGVVALSLPWIPALGLTFSLRMDGFSWMFAMLITGIGTLVVMYARYYMSPQDPVPRFFSFFLAFMGAMMGVVLSGNLIQLALFWELTSLASFMLIAYWHHRVDARQGARMALTVTAAGGLCLLAGVLLIGHIVGSYDLDEVLGSGELIRNHPAYAAVLVLVALGALTKSAQFPFHFWLPHAMAAPTPVSAYLHSATMVKAGVFLLTRLSPVLDGTELWFWVVGGPGLCTLVLGAYAAIFQQDLKGVLAYSTISHLGLITLLLGMNSDLATLAAIFHILNHAIFKASLFMAAGIIDHETGTRDMRRLSGLYRAMPITATLAMVASASMAGVPLLNGFLSKEMFFAETVYTTSGSMWTQIGLPVAATVAGAFSVIYSLRFIHQVFFGPLATDLPREPHEAPRWMRFPIEFLVLLCLVVGVVPGLTVSGVLGAAGLSVLGDRLPEFSLSVWHGVNLPLIMSLLALAGGVIGYYTLRRNLKMGQLDGTPLIYRFDGKRTFEWFQEALATGAEWLTRTVNSERLQVQMLALVCVVLAMGALALWGQGAGSPGQVVSAFDPWFALLWLLGGVCAIASAYQAKYHRLAAMVLMGGAGLVTCLTFAWLSAPDLALTQLGVEIVTLVLILLGLRWLPKRLPMAETSLRARLRRGRDLLIAGGAGAGIAWLSYAVFTRQAPDSIAPFFLERALPEGEGRNVVNVILVDFRGFDTLGEIGVLGIVALTVYALLRRFRPAPESMDLPHQQRDPHAYASSRESGELPDGYLRVPAVLVRLLLPVAALASVFFLLRGHNQPGGGFVGGLVMAMAVILQYMVGGTAWVESRMRLHPQHWVGLGILIAALTGAASWLAGQPYMDSLSYHGYLPLLGEIHLGSALFFDIGVYMLVVGATVLILVALAHQSARSHRKAGDGGAG